MRFDILTIFPKIFDSYLNESIIKRAIHQKLIKIVVHDIRKFSKDKHKKVDDIPYGGGAGMVMTAQPLWDCVEHVKKLNKGPVIYLSPKGKIFTQIKAENYAQKNTDLILLCGRYEGIDQRIVDSLVDEEISIGKYILNGGEVAVVVLIESISRLIPGVIGKTESCLEDSFSKKLKRKKEYPHYTRPEIFKEMKVPEVLLSGHHQKIEKWRESKLK